MKSLCWLMFVLLYLSCGSAIAGWNVVNLSPPGSGFSWASGVSDSQQTGTAVINNNSHAGMWKGSAASWVDLNPVGASMSFAGRVSGGQQVGNAYINDNICHAGLWRGTARSWVDLNPIGASSSFANDVSGGQQVGQVSIVGQDGSRASLWNGSAASWVDLNPAGVLYSTANGVSAGQQVGTAFINNQYHAVMWKGTAASLVDLNPIGSEGSHALGTSGDQQVGYAWINDNEHASLWRGNAASWVDLNPAGATSSKIYGVCGGLQVGYAIINGEDHAGLWNGTAASWIDLNDILPAGLYLGSEARSIYVNNTGEIWIVGGIGTLGVYKEQAMLWHYTGVFPPVPSPVPPPVAEENKPVILLIRGVNPLGFSPGDPLSDDNWGPAYKVLSKDLANLKPKIIAVGNDIFDGTGTIKEAGKRLKKVVEDYSKNGQCDVYIVAHSMGGLVTRSCLSQMGDHKKWVRKVIMLSTPNCGSHIPDVVVAGAKIIIGANKVIKAMNPWYATAYGIVLADKSGIVNNALCKSYLDLCTDTVLRYSRDEWKDSNSRYYLYGGTSNNDPDRVWNASFNLGSSTLVGWPAGTSVINGWPQAIWNTNDGAVTTMSALGQYWTGPVYNRQKAPTFSQGSVTTYSWNLNHRQMWRDANLIHDVASIIRGGVDATKSGYTTTSLAAKANVVTLLSDDTDPVLPDPKPAVELCVYTGSINNGQTKDYNVPIDQLASVTFALDYQIGNPTLILVDPDGISLNPESPGVATYESSTHDGLGRVSYTIPSPKCGHWVVRIIGTEADDTTPYAVMASGVGSVTLSDASERIQTATGCYPKARIMNSGVAVSGAILTADCLAPDGTSNLISLYDDGLHGDNTANDGLYAGQLINPAYGNYSAVLTANGSVGGIDYTRQGSTSFVVTPATASLNGNFSSLGVDEGDKPGYEKLRVNLGLDIVSGNTFRIFGALADKDGGIVATAVTERTDLVTGGNTVALDFDGDALHRSKFIGPLKLTNVVVSDMSFDPSLDVLEARDVYTITGICSSDYVDNTPPASVTTLAVYSTLPNSITLTWIAPDSEGSPAHAYELRMSEDGFSNGSWNTKTVVAGLPIPAMPGTQQSFTVNGVQSGKYYWFCIRSTDSNGNMSDLSNLTTSITNPVPIITSLSPNSIAAGSSGFTLTINGKDFVSGCLVKWNGTERPTRFISTTQVTAQITATDIASLGSSIVTFTNPAPGGGVSNSVFLIGTPKMASKVTFTRNGGQVQATVTVTNSGTASAGDVKITVATLGTSAASSLPISLGAIGFGESKSAIRTFNVPAGSSTFTIKGTYQAGSFGSSLRVTIP